MPEAKSYKICVTEDAHKKIKAYCALKGINTKEFVSKLILESISRDLVDLITEKSENISKPIPNLQSNHSPNERTPQMGSDISLVNADFTHNDAIKKDHFEAKRNKPSKAGNAAWQIYKIIDTDPTKAKTPEEIASLLHCSSKSIIQNALYWLLNESVIERKIREDPNDKRKNSWEYWKLENSDSLIIRCLDPVDVLKSIPAKKELAISVRDLSVTLGHPPSTVRDALKRLEQAGQVGSLSLPNHRNQTTAKYYRLPSERKPKLYVACRLSNPQCLAANII